MGKSSPSQPDPVATAQAQGTANEAAARTTTKLNNPSTYGPTGTVKRYWNGDDTGDVYTTLEPGQQRIYDNQTRLTGDASQAALDATGRMSNLLSTGLNTDGMQSWRSGPTGAPQLQTGINGAGQGITGNIAGAGQGIQTGITGAGQGIQTGISGAGQNIRDTIGAAGEGIQSRITGTGQGIQTGISGAGQGIRNDFAGATQGAQDYGAQRGAVEQAIMSRVQPQYAQDRAAMDAKLAAQGFTQGSQGYQQGADEINRSLTDARMQAVLAGGQEQSRLFGLDQSRLGFNNNATNTQLQNINSAQQQLFGQSAQNAQFMNNAQQQAVNQYAQEAQFNNSAQAQGFGQRAQEAQFGNQATAQRFDQAAQNAAFGNAAQQQRFGQSAQNATFGNQAQQQGFGQNAQNAQFGNDAQGQAFGQNAQNAAFYNTAAGQHLNSEMALASNQNQTRQQQLAERLQLRAQPINETASLFGLGNGVAMPSPVNASASQVAPADYQGIVSNNFKTGAANAAANNAASTQAASSAAMAAATIAAASIAASDRRVKDDIKSVGKLDNGLPVYSFRYKGDPKIQIGLMAQDVEKDNPDAVSTIFGIKHVDYRKAVGDA